MVIPLGVRDVTSVVDTSLRVHEHKYKIEDYKLKREESLQKQQQSTESFSMKKAQHAQDIEKSEAARVHSELKYHSEYVALKERIGKSNTISENRFNISSHDNALDEAMFKSKAAQNYSMSRSMDYINKLDSIE